MKNFFILLLIGISSFTYAQCTTCKSLNEANKAPLQVTSLLLNSYFIDEELTQFPKEIEQMKNLETLYFTDFEITEIPNFIGDLTKLKSLSFSGTSINSLPKSIFQLKNLTEIILLNTSLSKEYLINFEKEMKVQLPACKVLYK